MIPEFVQRNLSVWVLQGLIVTTVGGLLPLVFRIRHPRSNLFYFRALLAACFVLPFIQPIRHDVVWSDAVAQNVAAPLAVASAAVGAAPIRWDQVIFGILAAGFLLRLAWLVGGLWHIRRLTESSVAFSPLPESIRTACAMTRTQALFRISPVLRSPATFGCWSPTVLLPASFEEMSAEDQRSVVCHELLHVRRHDWLFTMIEEVLAAVLWFQPAVWWILAQTRLAREHLVDAAVVQLSASRETYIGVLLSLANGPREKDLLLASPFFRRRQLIQRMQFLLSEVSMSRGRLFSSYVSAAAILALAGWLTVVSFPLTGAAEVRETPRPPAQQEQNPPGYVVTRAPISYPPQALQRKIEGTVVVELSFNANGEIIDSRVLSGPEELRQAGLQTALQSRYSIDVARALQGLVEFKLPAVAPPPGAGQRGGAGQRSGGPLINRQPEGIASLSGKIVDAAGVGLPNVQVSATVKESGVTTVMITNSAGEYSFPALRSGTYEVSAELPAFQKSTFNDVRLGAAMSARLNFTLRSGGSSSSLSSSSASASATQTITPSTVQSVDVLAPGPADPVVAEIRSRLELFKGQIASNELVNQVKAIIDTSGNGTRPYQVNLVPMTNGTRLMVIFPDGSQLQRVRIGGNVAASNLIQRVEPVYPQDAKDAGITGTVVLEVNISKEGKVGPVRVITGNPRLTDAAIAAVSQWVYKPVLLNGQPVDAITTVTLNFQ